MPESLSFTKLWVHEDCPRKYRHQFVDKLRHGSPETIQQLVGSLVHAAIAAFHRRYPKPSPDDKSAILDIYDALAAETDSSRYMPPVDRTAKYYFQRGRALVHGYANEWPALFQETVLAVERPIVTRIEVGQHVVGITGVADKISTRGDDLIVTDFKTTANPARHARAEDFVQATIYWIGLQQEGENRPGFVRYHYLASQMCPTHAADDEVIHETIDWIGRVLRRIQLDEGDAEWHARPGARCRACPFAGLCPEGSQWIRSYGGSDTFL